jgi:hypothetical protein
MESEWERAQNVCPPMIHSFRLKPMVSWWRYRGRGCVLKRRAWWLMKGWESRGRREWPTAFDGRDKRRSRAVTTPPDVTPQREGDCPRL